MELTTEQKLVLSQMKEWIADDKADRLAVLTGYAGTGKTFLLRHFLKTYKHRVAITAPTHKAVYVASQMLGRKGHTLHKLHGLKPNMNLSTFDIDNIQFDPLNNPTIGDYTLIIIDEASMISRALLELNNQRASLFDVRILFVGDPLQLPPVGEAKASAFELKTKFQLTTVMRQDANNPIGKVMTLLRNDIRNNIGYDAVNYILKNPISIVEIDGIKSGYAVLNKVNFNTKLLEDFPLVKDGADIRYLGFSNDNVMAVNSHIRNNLIQSNEMLTEGDLITANTNTYDEFQQVVITNSSDYYIDSVEKRMSDYDFEIFIVNMRDTTTNTIIPPIKVVNHFNRQGYDRYLEILGTFHTSAVNADRRTRGTRWYEYFQFKGQYLSMLKATINGRDIDRDLSYGYANTVHKSQGSTYDISYVNLKDIVLTQKGTFRKNNRYSPHAISFANRLLYVALTRARYKTIMVWI